jgi:hypothetical protein
MKKIVGLYYRCSLIICLSAFLSLIGLIALSSSAFALQWEDFTYTESSGTITITGYACHSGRQPVLIPSAIYVSPVVGIGEYAFLGCIGLTSVTIPDSITVIGDYAFASCTGLTSAYFYGNAPSMGQNVFSGCASSFSICYTAGSTGFTTPKWENYPATQCAETISSANAIREKVK